MTNREDLEGDASVPIVRRTVEVTPQIRPPAPLRSVDLGRFELSAPITLDDLSDLQTALRALAPKAEIEAYSHHGTHVVVDLRWPDGARLTRSFTVC